MLKELMAKLRGAKTAAQWAAAITDLEGSVDTTSRNLTMLRAALKSAPFEKTEDEVAALRQRVRDNGDELAFLEGALEEARKRHDEAVEGERRAAVEARMKAAETDWHELAKAWHDFDKHMSAAKRATARAAELGKNIAGANTAAAAAGFSDLELRLPASNVAGILGDLTEIAKWSGHAAMSTWSSDGRMRKVLK